MLGGDRRQRETVVDAVSSACKWTVRVEAAKWGRG